jgi:hypothetical protein
MCSTATWGCWEGWPGSAPASWEPQMEKPSGLPLLPLKSDRNPGGVVKIRTLCQDIMKVPRKIEIKIEMKSNTLHIDSIERVS